jgi:hypothetical protein
MHRRSFLSILLSLVLLVSQQMAMTHVLGHWNASIAAAQSSATDGGVNTAPKSLAHGSSCAHCSGYAQLGFALGTTWNAHLASSTSYAQYAAAETPAACARSACGFLSRAPPLDLTA